VEILIEDLEFYFHKESDSKLVEEITKNCKRYIKLFYEAIDRILPERTKKLKDEDQIDPLDEILLNQRMQNLQHVDTKQNSGKTILPSELLRR
jgi:hypothetical protein